MNLHEQYHIRNRPAELLKEAASDRWLAEYRSGHPSLGQRMVIAAGEALERAGSWLKRRGGDRSYTAMNRGMSIAR